MKASDAAAPPTTLVFDAPAKLNLYLEVTGVREDGYHLIDSLVAFADFGDRLRIERAEKTSLAIDGPFAPLAPADDSNLVMRALRLLERTTGGLLPVAIQLEKRLPAGAGLGGGSADAAAVLRGVRTLYDLPLSDADLAALGLELGADLPVCLAGRPARVTGIGDRLSPAPPVPAYPTLLVYPGIGLSTPAVYHKYDDCHINSQRIYCARSAGVEVQDLAMRSNDLQPAAEALEPTVTQVLEALVRQDGCLLGRMSGSGSACFGLFESMPQVVSAAGRLKELSDLWWVQPCRVKMGKVI